MGLLGPLRVSLGHCLGCPVQTQVDTVAIIELAGGEDQVVKFLPALTIDEETLREGLAIIDKAIADLLRKKEELRTGDTRL